MRAELMPAVDVNFLATQLSQLATDLDLDGWFWLDGGSFGEPKRSYLGVAAESVECEVGEEANFIATLEKQFEDHSRGSAIEIGPDRHSFIGGWVLALGYEFGLSRMGLSQVTAQNPEKLASAFALRAPVVVEYDNTTGEAKLLTTHAKPEDRDLVRMLQRLLKNPSTVPEGKTPQQKVTEKQNGVVWRHDDDQYESLVRHCQNKIAEGSVSVLCLTNQATVDLVESPDPIAIYQRLRASSNAPRSGLIVHRDRALISASPERFLRLNGKFVRSAPIKGTRPRGNTPAEDAALALELSQDPKEREENTLILDLLRNDLNTVCIPGSIRIDTYCQVESYRQVHQLVSVIEGEIDVHERGGVWQIIDSIFPGASMTGAPKQRAVEILRSLEQTDRGLYSGCFGWVNADGRSAELAMTIRSVELRGATAIVGAGGGITSHSVATAEVAEMRLKARAVIDALNVFIEQ